MTNIEKKNGVHYRERMQTDPKKTTPERYAEHRYAQE